MQTLPTTIFTVATSLGALAAASVFVSSAVYDIRQARRILKTSNKKRPLCTVIVTAHNQAKTLPDALQAMFAGSYKKLQVIVIDNASSDETSACVRAYQLNYPKRALRLVVKKQKQLDQERLLKDVKRYVRGEFVVVTDAATFLDKHAIRTAVDFLVANPEIDQLLGATLPVLQYTIRSQSKLLGAVVATKTTKALAAFGVYRPARLRMYRGISGKHALKPSVVFYELFGGRTCSMRLSTTTSVIRKSVSWFTWLIAGLGTGYIWFLAFQDVRQPLALIWLAATSFGFICMISDRLLGLSQKLSVMMLIPAWFLLGCFYVVRNIIRPLRHLGRIRMKITLRLVDTY